MQLRVARHTGRLDAVVAFYRDGIGLVDLGGFFDHEGYSGAFLGIPGTNAHLELTAGGTHRPPEPHPESLLVLYLGSPAAVAATVARADAPVVTAANPYWESAGAVTLTDPDGFHVVLVPARWP